MVKTTLGSVARLLFVVIVLSANPLHVAPEAVLDTGNEELRAGVQYYIVSAIRGAGGGGVTMGENRIGTLCPRDVVQEPSDLNRGLPVTFFPVDNPKDGVVQLETDLNIRFSAPNFCRDSTVWKLDEFDQTLERIFVTTRGVIGDPGLNTLSNWFRIEKSSFADSYKIVFCPSVCDFCRPRCGDIGIFFDSINGVRRLALSDDPFRVIFHKANTSTTSSY